MALLEPEQTFPDQDSFMSPGLKQLLNRMRKRQSIYRLLAIPQEGMRDELQKTQVLERLESPFVLQSPFACA